MPRPSFAGRAASVAGAALPATDPAAGGGSFWIDHSIDAARFQRVSWADLETTLRRRPDLFRDRLVVVGADFAGAGDQVRLPNQGTVAGVVVQAMTADTILAGLPVRRSGQRGGFIASVIAAGVLSGVLLLSRARFLAPAVVLGLAAMYSVGAVLALRHMNTVVPVAIPLLMCGTAALLAWGVRRVRPSFPGR
jgi:CHASE2 domain-containing sensor protein